MMNLMEINEAIAELRRQEDALQWPVFNESLAWDLGCSLQQAARLSACAIHIEIEAFGRMLFVCAMPGTAPINSEWSRKKRNITQLLQRSSLAISLGLQRDETDLQKKMGLCETDYAAVGGCFPIRIVGCGMIGTVTVSGMPEFDDHALIIEVLKSWQENDWEKPSFTL